MFSISETIYKIRSVGLKAAGRLQDTRGQRSDHLNVTCQYTPWDTWRWRDLFNNIVPVKFTENGRIAHKSKDKAKIYQLKGYTTLFRQTLFRQTLFRQSMHSLESERRVADCSWIGLWAVLIGKTRNQIPKIRGSTIVFEVRCNFSGGGGGDPRPTGIPSQSPGSAPLSHLSVSINAVLWMHPTPRPIPICSQFRLFLHVPSVLKMYWVVTRPNCRLSE